MKKVIYIHGFNSAPQSEKAQLTQAWFDSHSSEFELVIAQFPPEPALAIQSIQHFIDHQGIENIAGFIGSSLGGFYSLHLHAQYAKPAVLINPALKPYRLLQDYLGPQVNLYTGEEHVVTQAHMSQLMALDRVDEATQSSVFVLTQTLDETLDYREALHLLPHARTWIQPGGNHSFEHYRDVLPAIHSFLLHAPLNSPG